VLWRALYNQFGISVRAVCEIAAASECVGKEGREKNATKIARFIDSSVDTKESLHGHNVRSGWSIVILYLFIKLLYLLNAIAQFFILQHFLGAKSSWWGLQVLDDLAHGRQWTETGNFPRVTYCDFDVREMGNLQHHTVQCVLLINFLNEKIFVFLWFWFLFVAVATGLSLIYWIVTSFSAPMGQKIITGYLGLSDETLAQSRRAQTLVNRFISESVRPNGIFLIRFVAHHGGDLVAADLTHALWNGFKRRNRLDEHTNGQTNPSAPVVSLASPYSGYPTLPRYDEAVTASPDKESGL